jgi:cell volume regulation protein A
MQIDAPEEISLEEVINQKLSGEVSKGDIVVIGNVQIRVITMVHTRIVTIGLKYLNNPEKRLLKK